MDFLFWKIKHYLINRYVQSKEWILLLLNLWVGIFCIKKQVNLIKTFMIKLISFPCNSQYIKTTLQKINLAKLLKVEKLIF